MEIQAGSPVDTPTYDRTGKMSLDHVYNQPDPRAYFRTLRKLDYRVPAFAKPVFSRLLDARREQNDTTISKVVDVGCSYGVNAALLKHDLSLDELYWLYGDGAPADREALIARDRVLFSASSDGAMEVVGVDAAEKAVAYALEAGLMDAGVSTNLERRKLLQSDRSVTEKADMIISTGCVGYVTETALEKLVETSEDNDVWMANFVLRMFDYEPIEDMMAERGFVTEKLSDAAFPQRRFVSDVEQGQVLDSLSSRGLSPEGLEDTGWYMAELYVSRPAKHAQAAPIEAILA